MDIVLRTLFAFFCAINLYRIKKKKMLKKMRTNEKKQFSTIPNFLKTLCCCISGGVETNVWFYWLSFFFFFFLMQVYSKQNITYNTNISY